MSRSITQTGFKQANNEGKMSILRLLRKVDSAAKVGSSKDRQQGKRIGFISPQYGKQHCEGIISGFPVVIPMCGFIGILSNHLSREGLFGEVTRVLSTLKHRGPDGEGTWFDPSGSVGLGHRRLAILDLSNRAAQPMQSHDGRYVLAYNGEVYNHQEIRALLQEEGYPFAFRSHSDTEVVLSALSWWGMRDALRRFRGMFALCLWDREERSLMLARDPIGIKPLYYGMTESGFAAASELRAFKALSGFGCHVQPHAVTLFLQHGYVPAPHSIFKGVSKLAPGTYVTVELSDIGQQVPKPKPFLTVDDVIDDALENPFGGTFVEAVEAVSKAVDTAVRRHLLSDVPVGLLLSGGIDSSLVASAMAAIGDNPGHAFIIGFPGWEEGDEATYAEQVANKLGMTHTRLDVSPQMALDIVPDLSTVYDEPFADPSALPTLLVCRLARQEVTVGLSGDGGDELFFGYQRYPEAVRRLNHMKSLARVWRGVLPRTFGLASRAYQRMVLPLVDRRGRRYRDLDGIHRSLVDPRIDVVYRRATRVCEPSAWLSDAGSEIELSNTSTMAPVSTERWMMRHDLKSYLPDDILVKVDRASMWHGLEVRPPLLDMDLVKLSWSLPDTYLYDRTGGKRILRELLYGRLPRELVKRPKRGFGPPVGRWMRGELREWVESALSEDGLRNQGLFDVKAVRSRWKAHVEGRADWTYQLWAVVMLQDWLMSL